jgi:hypothetical protein
LKALAPFLQDVGGTRKPRRNSDETVQRLGKLFIPEAVDQRTLQICHVEATHCVVSKSIDVTIDQILFRNKSVTREWCGRTIPSIPGFFDRRRPRSVGVVDAIEPNAVVRKEERTQSMKCM